MASKLVEAKEAADLLGITPEQLNSARISGEISGVRDAGTWKFKMEEVERLAEDRGITLKGAQAAATDDDDEMVVGGDSGLAISLDDDDFEVDSPTTIGKPGSKPSNAPAASEGSDLTLSFADDEKTTSAKPVGNDKAPAGKATKPGSGLGSDLNIDELDKKSDGSGFQFSPSDSSVLAGTEMNLQNRGGGGTGDLDFEGSDLGLVSDNKLGSDDDLALGDDDLTIGDDSGELAVGGDDDDELVLESGSDITRGAGDTGINLAKPSDSGLNLEEEPLDLAGSSVSSLELPEDDDIIDLDDLDTDPDQATQLKAGEDFNLEQPGMADLEETAEDDSGSQVIALEDSEAFGLQATPLAGAAAAAAPRGDELEGALDQVEVRPVTQPALPDIAYRGPLPEMPYSIWNVLSLLLIVMVLATTGMLMTDLVRNMWSWDQTFPASSSIMDSMVKMLGLDP